MSVYFIRAKCRTGRIKVGHSRRPDDRLADLLTWSPVDLEIVATVPGGHDLEYRIHCCLAHLHFRREWFDPDPLLLTCIERLQNGAAIEDAIDLTARTGDLRRQFYERRSELRRARAARKLTAPTPGQSESAA